MLERVDGANPRRLARAIEVKEATGRSLRDWQEETPEALVGDFTAFWIEREKAELEARIEARVEAMFAEGWVEEVRGLIAKYGAEAVLSFPGIGYREIGEMLERGDEAASCALRAPGQQVVRATRGEEGTGAGPAPATLKSDICVATRQYAKRQLTWFARESILEGVMLTGNQSFSAALSAAGLRL
jgi:tRNA dimethylallyltransferase